MIIKTAIKHLIYEACIHQLFSGIQKNFSNAESFNPVINKIYKVIKCKGIYGFRNECYKYVMLARIFRNGYGKLCADFYFEAGHSRGGFSTPIENIYYVEE